MPSDRTWGSGYLNASYHPHDFRDRMLEYADREGSECPYVPSGYYCPDYSVLSGDALNYYFWWRSGVRAGKARKTDRGYVWLLMTELVNTGDPEESLRTMTDLIGRLAQKARFPGLEALPRDFALSRGLSDLVPRGDAFAVSRHAFLRDLTRHPMRMPDARLLEGHVEDRWYEALDDDSRDALGGAVGLSLAGIDELVRSTRGRGLLSYLGCTTVSSDEGRIRGFPDWTGTPAPDLSMLDPDDRAFDSLLDGIIRTAIGFMKDPKARGPPAPRSFPQEYVGIVAAAVDAATVGDPWDPSSFRKGAGGFWEDDDAMLERSARAPVIIPTGRRSTKEDAPPLSRADMEAHWSENPAPGARYVPSGGDRISYRTMGPEQLAFYLSWRSGARNGTYSDIDRGYLWLYCSELLEMSTDPIQTQSRLDGAIRAYRLTQEDAAGYERDAEYLFEASAGNALLNGLEPDRAAMSVIPSDFACYMALASCPVGRIDPYRVWQFTFYNRYDPSDRDGVYEGAFTAAVRAADEALRRAEGRRLVDLSRFEHTTTLFFFRDLWAKLRTSRVYMIRDVMVPGEPRGTVEGVLKTALRLVHKGTGLYMPKIPKGLPKDIRDAVESAVTSYLEGLEEADRRERLRRDADAIVLDRSAVDSAEADLAAVTGMMAVSDGEEAPDEAPAPVPETSDPWEAFASMLDDIERGFLLASLDGDGRSALAGTGRRAGEAESSINAKAMDSAGDAVMEDGAVFEEYADDIRRVLG